MQEKPRRGGGSLVTLERKTFRLDLKDGNFCPQISCKNRKFVYEVEKIWKVNQTVEKRKPRNFFFGNYWMKTEAPRSFGRRHINKKEFPYSWKTRGKQHLHSTKKEENGLTFLLLIKRMTKSESSSYCSLLIQIYSRNFERLGYWRHS